MGQVDNPGKAMFQLSYYEGGKRVQRNFTDKAEAKRVARAIVGDLAEDAEVVDKLSTAELESYVAARKVLSPNYVLHVAVAEHAQAVSKLGKSTLQEAVQFFLRHHKSEVGRVSLPPAMRAICRISDSIRILPRVYLQLSKGAGTLGGSVSQREYQT